MLSDEPNKVAEVGSRRFVPYELQHVWILHPIDVQRDRTHRDPYHRLRVIEKFDRFRVKREIIRMFIVEEMYRVRVQLEAKRLEKQNVIPHYVLVREVELVNDDRIDEIIA